MTVENPQGFVDDPLSKGVVETGIATTLAGVDPADVEATLTVGSRRLGRSLQSGTVDVAAVITVEDAAAATTIQAAAAAITPDSMATAITAAANAAGMNVSVVVTDFVVAPLNTDDSDGAFKPAVVPILAGLAALFFSF